MELAQTIFYVVSPLVTLMAVCVAYIAVARQSRPQLLIYYIPNPDIQSFIDLVIENVGNGLARDIVISEPLPIRYFGIEESDGSVGEDILEDGVPALAAGQRLVFNAGQYGGLSSRIKEPIDLRISYSYRNPLGIKRKKKGVCVLSIEHIVHMPSRSSGEHVLVDALKGNNRTTLKTIATELTNLRSAIDKISKKITDD